MKYRTISHIVLLLIFISISGGWSSRSLAGASVDHSIYAELLTKYVKNGRVDYAGFKSEESMLDDYLKILEAVDSKNLSDDEQFAFYTNAYNAWTIKLILSGYPEVKSIKDYGNIFKSPWKKEIVRIDGKVITLDNVEHDILRPRFKDPRVHFAINCAAISCPPLRSEPFEGDILSSQLDDSTRSFLNNPTSYRFEGNTFFVSRIFKWFAEDFNHDVLSFYLKFAEGDLKQMLQANQKNIQVKYLDYDWSLNILE
jgi:hypothetical protein